MVNPGSCLRTAKAGMTLTAVSTTNAVRTGTCLVTAEALRTVTALLQRLKHASK